MSVSVGFSPLSLVTPALLAIAGASLLSQAADPVARNLEIQEAVEEQRVLDSIPSITATVIAYTDGEIRYHPKILRVTPARYSASVHDAEGNPVQGCSGAGEAAYQPQWSNEKTWPINRFLFGTVVEKYTCSTPLPEGGRLWLFYTPIDPRQRGFAQSFPILKK